MPEPQHRAQPSPRQKPQVAGISLPFVTASTPRHPCRDRRITVGRRVNGVRPRLTIPCPGASLVLWR